jgi:hypothetical protein
MHSLKVGPPLLIRDTGAFTTVGIVVPSHYAVNWQERLFIESGGKLVNQRHPALTASIQSD